MSDRIDLGGRPWKAIPRDLLRDERLSLKARGALVTLLSHDDGWVRSAIGLLMREARCGRDAAKAAMAELRETGYAELITERDLDGQLRRHYVIFAEPRTSDVGTSESPGDGKPIGRETRRRVSRSKKLEPQTLEPLEVEPQNIFAEFYRIYPRHEKPREAERAFKQALKRASAEEILNGVRRYADDPNLPTDKTFISHPASWLNGDGWLSDPLPARLNGARESREERLARLAEGM